MHVNTSTNRSTSSKFGTIPTKLRVFCHKYTILKFFIPSNHFCCASKIFVTLNRVMRRLFSEMRLLIASVQSKTYTCREVSQHWQLVQKSSLTERHLQIGTVQFSKSTVTWDTKAMNRLIPPSLELDLHYWSKYYHNKMHKVQHLNSIYSTDKDTNFNYTNMSLTSVTEWLKT